MESFDDRLRRFLGSEDEVPLTLILWAQNLLLPGVRVARAKRLDNLLFLSTHAFIQTFSEKALGKLGRAREPNRTSKRRWACPVPMSASAFTVAASRMVTS